MKQAEQTEQKIQYEQIKQEATLLPLVMISGTEYLVDIDLREFRDFNDSDNIVKMHSDAGKQFIRKILGTSWNCMGISTGRQKK